MAKIGTLIDGKYEVLREIGRGGMSVVYLAMDTRLNKQWAIKEIARKANDANNEIVVSSLLAEANLMKKLDHPALPRIVDIIEEHDTIYVVMDYIEGEPLSKILELYGAQDQDTVIEWGKQLCDVLFYLHNCEPPIIYRDMKPANVMLKPDGTVKLIDFGIAREYKRSKTADTESLGTRGYAAPEQFGGKGQTDARTDIYCFGVTLYHLVTGLNPCEPPYELYPIKQVNPNYYDGLQYLIQKCVQINPDDRFQSCDEVRYVLDNMQEFSKGRRMRQKKRFSAFIAMVVCTIVFALLGTGMFMGAKASFNSNFSANVSAISQGTNFDTIHSTLDTFIEDYGKNLSDDQKLEIYAAYFEAADKFSSGDASTAQQVFTSVDKININPLEFVTKDKLTAEEAEQLGVNQYSRLTTEQRTLVAKILYHQASILFKQNSSSKINVFADAQSKLSHVIDEDELSVETSEINKTEFTDEMIKNAKAIYYLSIAHSAFTGTSSSGGSSVSFGESENEEDNAKDKIAKIVDSIDILENTSSDSNRISFYNAYHLILDRQDRIKSFKNSGVPEEDVNAIYKAIYGVDYMTVYNQAVAEYGSIDSAPKDAANNLSADLAKDGIYSIVATDNSTVKTIISNRFTIAGYIYKAYKG